MPKKAARTRAAAVSKRSSRSDVAVPNNKYARTDAAMFPESSSPLSGGVGSGLAAARTDAVSASSSLPSCVDVVGMAMTRASARNQTLLSPDFLVAASEILFFWRRTCRPQTTKRLVRKLVQDGPTSKRSVELG